MSNTPYFEAVRGNPHFKDEMPEYTHHAVEVLIFDGRLAAQKTLDGRELIISTQPKTDEQRLIEVRNELRVINTKKDRAKRLEDARVSGQYFSNGDKI